jgi:RNA polymerase sigma factor (sigma-70 family)
MQESFLNEPDPERSWRSFLETCLPTVDRVARRAVGDDEFAADVAAEVMRRLSADWPALLTRFENARAKAPAGFRVWLAVVARSQAIDVLRSLRGRAMLPRPIARMPDWQQRLWKLVVVEERTPSEAAEVLASEGLWRGSMADLAQALVAIEAALPRGPRLRQRPRFQALDAETDEGSGVESGRWEPASAPSSDPSRTAACKATHAAFVTVLSVFASDERALLRMYFLSEMTAAEVARVAGYEGAPQVYEKIRGLVRRLRAGAESRGLGPSDLADLSSFDWDVGLASGSIGLEDRR